ncbi:hypothetical protein [Celeribacter sp.]|uniref:hypothetical protein n=1 Tax=Celeribacter sp. TaxID=1890673 RepID=UPI003A8E5A73
MLFRLDAETYEAAQASAEAALDSAQATLNTAQAHYDRYAKLEGVGLRSPIWRAHGPLWHKPKPV